jgi:excisionase family DNA binding protein
VAKKYDVPPPRLLEVHEVGFRLNISAEAVRRLLRAGKLPGVHIGSMWRVDRDDLQDFLTRRARSD